MNVFWTLECAFSIETIVAGVTIITRSNDTVPSPSRGMNHPRSKAAAVIWKDKIVIGGGCFNDRKFHKNMECFDPESGVWSEWSDLPSPRLDHSLLWYDNQLIVMGGYDGEAIVDTVWALDPLDANRKWKELPSMNYPASEFGGIILDNEIYAIGGKKTRQQFLCLIELQHGVSLIKDLSLGPLYKTWSLPYQGLPLPLLLFKSTFPISQSFHKLFQLL